MTKNHSHGGFTNTCNMHEVKIKSYCNASTMYLLGYEPADLTVHPPPRTAEGGFIFFV